MFSDAINGYRDKSTFGKMEIDIYIPSIKTAIEYDGHAWHGSNKRDIEKTRIAKSLDIEMIRLREFGTPEIDDGSIILLVDRKDKEVDYEYLSEPISVLLDLLLKKYGGEKPNVDIDRDFNEVASSFLILQKEKSLASLYPEVARDFHPTKNGQLNPERIKASSGQMVWWKCSTCGHEWKSRISDRTLKGQGCLICGNKEGAKKRKKSIILETGSFADNYPELLCEWDYTKNTNISPNDVTPFSSSKVWWKCSVCGHEWEARIVDRSSHGYGCKECGYGKAAAKRRKQIVEANGSLADRFPDLLLDWDYTKNIDVSPNELPPFSNKKVWWKCSVCGNEWETPVAWRSHMGQGCPSCYRAKTNKNQISMDLSQFYPIEDISDDN